MGVAQLHEAGALVGRRAVDRAGKVQGIVGDDTDRPAFDTDQRGDHAVAKAFADLKERAVVGHGLDHVAHIVGAQPIGRHRMP